MAKKRVYELAKKLKVENKDILTALESIGITGKTHSSSVEDEVARKVTERIKKAAQPKQVPRAVHKVKKAPQAPMPVKAEAKPEAEPAAETAVKADEAGKTAKQRIKAAPDQWITAKH